ncbi:MAG: hypothetical protein GXP08_13105 [Gammaproteobacteria bacterium]|nr:hypothetical protein [Gammaproteobacteria bacterium]
MIYMAWLLPLGAGMILACMLVFHLRQKNHNKKYQFLGYALIVTALIYVVLAVFSADLMWISIEVIGCLVFLLLVWLAYQYSFWFVAMGWLIHIVWDMGLSPFESAPYVPGWYPAVCTGFDLVLGLYLAYLLIKHSRQLDYRV